LPSQGVGGNGTASEFGDLTGMTRPEVDEFLKDLGANVKTTSGGYAEYIFADGSRVYIRSDGEVVRTPAPKYGPDGRRINKGWRLNRDGSILPTRDEFGNPIANAHNTEERVRD